ncbi:hypothetical protein ZIOFF_042231 [Zingiber officinale]|uniref:Pentatricopeptide repeat-containing protein n=1 Tax=Zingiber officinale TaxID=94328 RepID=A0A8J5GF13_ZINOF|nr:hypothetical protein ZIOFF_042231 [Zingiber officinale]
MLRCGLRPDHYTFPFVLLAAANLQSLYHGLAAHASIFKLALHDVDHVQHSLLTMYARCGQVGLARKLFDEIVVRDSVSWNLMLSGYAKMGCAGEAVELFRRMRSEGLVEPDEVTLVSVLAACGDLGDVSLGMWLEELVGEYGLVLNSFLGSSMIDMYGKCGDLDSARRVFDRLAKKDLVAWNAMITGYISFLFRNSLSKFHSCCSSSLQYLTVVNLWCHSNKDLLLSILV